MNANVFTVRVTDIKLPCTPWECLKRQIIVDYQNRSPANLLRKGKCRDGVGYSTKTRKRGQHAINRANDKMLHFYVHLYFNWEITIVASLCNLKSTKTRVDLFAYWD